MSFGLGSHTMDQAMVLFGPPKYITGFYRALRHPGQGFTSESEDTFDIIMDYGVEGGNMLVEVKTSVVSRLVDDLKWFVRGYEGSFVKFGVDQQEPQVYAGMKSTDRECVPDPLRNSPFLALPKGLSCMREIYWNPPSVAHNNCLDMFQVSKSRTTRLVEVVHQPL